MEHANRKYRYAIKLLHELYIYLNESFFESALSSEPVITIQFDPTDNILGWFKPKEVWVEGDGSHGSTEMNITAQYLNRPIEV